MGETAAGFLSTGSNESQLRGRGGGPFHAPIFDRKPKKGCGSGVRGQTFDRHDWGNPEIWNNEEIPKTRTESQAKSHRIPLQVLEFKPDVGQRMDPRTQTMIDYNDSSLLLERGDGAREKFSLLIDERGKTRGVAWNMGEIMLASLVPGEGDLGPYRLGQIFSYAGRDFLIRDASASKVSLELLPEKEKVEILPKTP